MLVILKQNLSDVGKDDFLLFVVLEGICYTLCRKEVMQVSNKGNFKCSEKKRNRKESVLIRRV